MAAALNILIGASLAAGQFTQSWLEEESFPGAVGQDSAAAMAHYVDQEGIAFVYVTGYASTPLGGRVIATHKYFAEPQTPQKFAPTVYYPLDPTFVSTMHEAVAMAVNPDNGDVYVAGTSRSGVGTDTDMVVIKYDAGLNQKWERRIGTLANDRAAAIVLDYKNLLPEEQRVYVTGTAEGFGTMEDMLTVNLQAIDGQLSGDWANLGTLGNGKGMRRYDHPIFHGADRAADMAYSTAFDGFANIFIVGTSWQGSRGDDIFVIAYDSNGDVLAGVPGWPQFFDVNFGNDSGVAIARDEEGSGFGKFDSHVFVAGTVQRISGGPPTSASAPLTRNPFATRSSRGAPLGASSSSTLDTDYATISYSRGGFFRWAQGHDGPSITYDDDVAVDIILYGANDGFVATTGNVRNGPLYDIETVRYTVDGSILGSDRYGAAHFDEHVTAMADSEAGAFLTGWIDYGGIEFAPVSYLTIKYETTWGNPDWWVTYPGVGLTDSKSFALTVGVPQVGAGQDVFVSGLSQRFVTGEDNVTIRYVDGP
jgi:hypothetical protein